jgi:cell shape-determining protein MreC
MVARPDIEFREKPKRRTFTAAYKSRILSELSAAPPGGVAAILRREGLYSSTVQKWRAAREDQQKRKAGRKKNPLTAENRKLKEELVRMRKQLNTANKIIELQKKVSEILGVTLNQIEEDE